MMENEKDFGVTVVVGGSQETKKIERQEENLIELGEWRWVDTRNYKGEVETDFYCATHIGSNYVKFNSPHSERDHGSSVRIHFDDLHKHTKRERESGKVLGDYIEKYRDIIREATEDIKQITSDLGVGQNVAIAQESTSQTTALVVMTGKDDINNYETRLVKAKDKDLPALFEKIKRASSELGRWMGAEILPMEASRGTLNGSIKAVEDRIFKVSLYAGLTEMVDQIQEGEPALINSKLHIMQRRLYMDEECLLGYRHGGMEFKEIGAFDEWLLEPDNLNRILPFDRCMVAFRVRRNEKERENDGSLHTSLINFRLAEKDTVTFLYVKNGDNVYRMNCDLDFGSMIFPDKDVYNPGIKMMIKGRRTHNTKDLITVYDYEERCKAEDLRVEYSRQWKRLNLEKDRWNNPYRSGSFDKKEWRAFDPTNVYYDDMLQTIADEMDQYNRIVLIIQGLYDRSEVLHPHPPIRVWEADDFTANIKLIYDGDHILAPSIDPPSFEAYREYCNLSMCEGSMVIGQEDFWERKEGRKETNRIRNDYRCSGKQYYPTHFTPYGNPGPDYIAKIDLWKPRAKKATFKWIRQRQTYNKEPWQSWDIETSVVVPIGKLFNVSSYKIGDFKQFFEDPRTRVEYLKWAPMLLAAEEYHAKISNQPKGD